MNEQYKDLSVSIHLSYAEAKKLARFIVAHGDDSDERTLSAVEVAITNAEKERDRQDRSA